MLMSLRQAVHKKAIKYTIFGVLILSFGMWGIADIFIPSEDYDTVVLTAGKREFTYLQVEQSYLGELRALGIDARTANSEILQNVLDHTMERMTINALNSQEIASLEIAGDRNSVLQQIRDNRNFYDAFGNFNGQIFRQFLAISGLSEADYMGLIAEDLGAQNWLLGLQATIAVPQGLAKVYGDYLQQVRDIDYVSVSYDKVKEEAFNDSDLRSYYEEVRENYRVEEERKFSLVDITAETLAEEITPSEEDIRALYDSGAYDRSGNERRDISFAVFADKASADTAYNAVQAGETLASAASAAGAEAQSLKEQSRTDIADTILSEQAYALAEIGDLAEVFEGSFGWVVLKLDGISGVVDSSFEAVRDEVAADILAERSADAIYQAAQDLEDAIAGGASLAEAARLINVEVKQQSNFDDLSPAVSAEVFNLAEGEISTLLEYPNFDGGIGGFFILQADKIKESHISDFADIKSQVRVDFIRAQQTLALEQSAEQVRQGALDLQGFATLWGGQVKRAAISLGNTGEHSDYPPPLSGAEFRNNPVGYTAHFNGDEFLLARLEEVRTRDAEEIVEVESGDGHGNAGERIMSRLMQNIMVRAYEDFLRQKYRITYNRELLGNIILGYGRLAGHG